MTAAGSVSASWRSRYDDDPVAGMPLHLGDRFLAAIDQPTVEALRAVFREDLVSRPLVQEGSQNRKALQKCPGVQMGFG